MQTRSSVPPSSLLIPQVANGPPGGPKHPAASRVLGWESVSRAGGPLAGPGLGALGGGPRAPSSHAALGAQQGAPLQLG